MDFSHYSDEPVQLAVELINTFDTVSGEETLSTLQDVADLVGDRASRWAESELTATPDDLLELRRLRGRLRAVFDAEDARMAAETLNSVLVDVGAMPRISVHGEGPHLHFETSQQTMARWLGAIAAMGLTTALIEGGFDRFGTCDSSTCDDVYVDTSRNRSRRNCSEKCTTRENVAAYRSRQSG